MKVIVFDLDDTLYKEIDFLKSAYHEIVEVIGHPEAFDFMLDCYFLGENAFQCVIYKYNLSYTVEQLLVIYRNHKPGISLAPSTIATLDELKASGAILCLLTDGRSVTQRNKIEALGLVRWFSLDDILISEEFGHSKPSMECYHYFINRHPDAEFVVIGDNPAKDFITPNKLGWTTICLCSNGQNIHDQNLEVEKSYLPKHSINNLSEIKRFC